MLEFNFRGLMAPVFTPFNADFELRPEIIPSYVQFLKSNNIQGILVNGTSGEGMSMSVDERKSIAKAWIKESRKVGMHVMLQVGGAPLPDVIELTKHAELLGADSILTLPELYHKPTSVEELIEYLKIISGHAPNTPLLYYHIPSLTNVQINMTSFVEEAQKAIPTFKGLKFTSNDLNEGISVHKACGEDCAIFLGADQLLLSSIAAGFDSSIGTTFNIFPKYSFDVMENLRKNDITSARKAQDLLNARIKIILDYGTWVPAMKAAMQVFTDINLGPVRPPLKNLNLTEVKLMGERLKI